MILFSMKNFFIILFLTAIVVLMVQLKHVIMLLLSVEYMLLSIFVSSMFFLSSWGINSMGLIVLIISASGASMGLTMLVIFSRSFSKMYMNNWWMF